MKSILSFPLELIISLLFRSKDSKRLLYSGDSLAGFYEIWKVPTGRQICTVAKSRRVLYQGNYQGDELQVEAMGFLPSLPRSRVEERIESLATASYQKQHLCRPQKEARIRTLSFQGR